MEREAGAGMRRGVIALAAAAMGVALLMSAGCTKHEKIQAAEELYFPVDGAVGLEIITTQSSGDEGRTWLASYSDASGTTKFHIELEPAARTADGGRAIGSGKGRFRAEPGSNPLPLLIGMQKALQAKHLPSKAESVEVLPFEYVLLGDNQSRSHDDSFRDKPPGNWTAMKVFLGQGKGECELFLNVNAEAHQAEFAIKDAEYGDAVLKQMAKVL